MFFFVVACTVLLKTFQLLTSFSLPAQLSYIINESSLMQTAKFTERAGRKRQGLYEGSVSSGSREVSCSEQQHKRKRLRNGGVQTKRRFDFSFVNP